MAQIHFGPYKPGSQKERWELSSRYGGTSLVIVQIESGRMPDIKMDTYLECICAIHLSSLVESPFRARGGLMVIGPPGALKTTMIRTLEEYHDSTVASDLNNVTLSSLREGMSAGTLRTIVLPELKKIYQHHPSVSSNLEGTLQAMADEGFSQPSFRDSRMQGTKARCTIVSALTENFYQKKYTEWGESGFSRRFLWSLISLKEPEILMEAVSKWKAIDIELEKIIRVPPTEHIPETLDEADRRRLRNIIKYQPGSGPLQYQVLCKMAAVLKWHYGRRRIEKNPIKTILEFGQSLSKEGAQIVL